MNAAVLWIVIPALSSVIIMIIRRNYPLASLVQIVLCAGLALAAFFSTTDPGSQGGSQFIVLDPVLTILGRSFVIDTNLRSLIIVLYSFLAAWTLGLYVYKIQSRVVPLGLPFFALLISSLAVEPFLYSGLLIEIAVILGVIIVADANAREKKGVLRFLIFFTIGMPFVLLAGWYLAGGEITPVNENQLIQATLLLGLGFVFWLGVFPFQSWIPLIAEENRMSESMLILITMPVVIIMLLLKYLNGFVWLREYQVVFQAIRLFGLIMAFTGASWAYFQKSRKRLVSHLLVFSTGVMLLSVSLNSPDGVYLSTYLVFSRLAAFFLLTWVLILLERNWEAESIASLRSLFFQSPLLGISLMVSLFTIAGMPITVGFPIMQALYAYLSAENQILNTIIILSSGLLSLEFIRMGFLVFSSGSTDHPNPISPRSSEKMYLIVLVSLLLLSGLAPKLFLSGFERMVSGYEFLVK